MKYIHLIKLLSVLLCIVMLFAACSEKDSGDETTASTDTTVQTGGDTVAETDPETAPETEAATETEATTETEAATEPDTHAPVDPTLENFFGFEYLENWNVLDPESLTRLEVDPIHNTDHVLVYMTRDVDTKNNVTDTYTVYNKLLGEVVFERSVTYKNGNYDELEDLAVTYDEEGNPEYRYPSVVLDIHLEHKTERYYDDYEEEYVSREILSYLCIKEYTFTEIAEEIREANPNGYFYDVTESYEYYDLCGNEIATANHELNVSRDDSHADVISFRFGTTLATFDTETYQMLSKVGALETERYDVYDVENAKYGYVLNGWTDTQLYKRFLDVFNKKTGDRVLRYYYNAAADEVDAWVLRNGDVLIQEVFELDDDSATEYDFMDGSADKYRVDHYILDVETGLTEQVEFSCLLYEVSSRDAFAEEYNLAENGITLTENAVNLAVGIAFQPKGMIDYYSYEILVLDNDLEVMFKLDRLVPEHEIEVGWDLGIRVLKNGYYLIDLYGGASAEYAIVNEKGEIVSYITENMAVVGDYIVTDDAIYDYNMNLKMDLSSFDYELVDIVGDKVIYSMVCNVSILDDPFDRNRVEAWHENGFGYVPVLEDEYVAYSYVDLSRETLAMATLTVGDAYYTYEDDWNISDEYGSNYRVDITRYYQKTVIWEIMDDFMITYDCETGKYTLWNTELEHVLTTADQIYISPLSEDCDEYLIETYVPVYDEYDNWIGQHTLLYTVSISK